MKQIHDFLPVCFSWKFNLNLTYAVEITIKSIIFHTFRRYDFSWNIKPIAIILHVASTQNIPRKIGSAASKVTAIGVRSPSGKCCSDAITRQFAIIVTRTAYSNGGHSIRKRISLRNGWSSANRNKDVGPVGTGAGIAGIILTFTFWFDANVDGGFFGVDTVVWGSCAANLKNTMDTQKPTGTLRFFFSNFSLLLSTKKNDIWTHSGTNVWNFIFPSKHNRNFQFFNIVFFHIYISILWTYAMTHRKYSISDGWKARQNKSFARNTIIYIFSPFDDNEHNFYIWVAQIIPKASKIEAIHKWKVSNYISIKRLQYHHMDWKLIHYSLFTESLITHKLLTEMKWYAIQNCKSVKTSWYWHKKIQLFIENWLWLVLSILITDTLNHQTRIGGNNQIIIVEIDTERDVRMIFGWNKNLSSQIFCCILFFSHSCSLKLNMNLLWMMLMCAILFQAIEFNQHHPTRRTKK